jgi:hypothetical protein
MKSDFTPRVLALANLTRRTSFFAGAFVLIVGLGSTARAQYGYSNAVQELKIIEHPQSQTIEQGQTATLKVKLEELKEGHTYSIYWEEKKPVFQWMKNGARIAGATTENLTLTNAQPSHSGAYQVVVYDKHVSQTATLTVYIPVPATILTQPMGATVEAGRTATLSVTAGGTPAPTYRWRKNGLPIAGATTATLTFDDVQPADEGSYDVLVANTRNSVFSRAVKLQVIVANQLGAPSPDSAMSLPLTSDASVAVLHRTPGESATLSLPAVNANASHQWKHNGLPITGATGTSLAIPAVTAAAMGFYSIVETHDGMAVETLVAALTVASIGTSRLANLSTRGYVGAGGALTPGFTLSGTGSARLLVRAVGPTLARFGLSEAHRDPALEIMSAGATLLANDNWATASNALDVNSTTASVGAFALDTFAKDAAVVASFASDRSYTTRIVGSDSAAAGVVLAEVYDPGSVDNPVRLAAVSTLGHVGSGDRALVSGFTIAGTAAKRLLIRAVGPGLATFGVTDPLADPQLLIVPAGFQSAIAANDNWQGDATIAATAKATGAFALDPASRDAAIAITLPPGGYTVTVSGRAGTAGTALVEIYDLDR